eukprot:CAMPEP_0198284524 /NCGR_PEP_ID=MMETSP1449-20131203/3983_1 /TAXON_ID=420275 /ORGANISM="Attheya septentrionalis, Strain CCMP2084" /LENGTH=76 /DNA_ID=CAMNT_0043981623 /DNA_START=45 /DNA_END=272 /DNA_ORIENTATION=+
MKSRGIVSLLASRETKGRQQRQRHPKVLGREEESISFSGAWNASRMQNMILAVGPGTPASVVMPSLDSHSSSGESA